MNSCSKFSIEATEEIEHEREAAQSRRSGRVVCRLGNIPRVHFRSRNAAERQRKTAGCRGAGAGQKGRKKRREERRKKRREKRRKKRREKRPTSEVQPKG